MNWLTRIFVRDERPAKPSLDYPYANVPIEAPIPPPFPLPSPNDPCPGCGGERFTIGCTTIVGRRGAIVTESAVVCCLACGEHWYGTPQGWRKPCESALPPAWAAQKTAARMEAAQAEMLRARRSERDDGKGLTRRRAANEGFRRPPRVDEEE